MHRELKEGSYMSKEIIGRLKWLKQKYDKGIYARKGVKIARDEKTSTQEFPEMYCGV